MLSVIYSLLVEETKEGIEARQRINEKLTSLTLSHGGDGKPDRATWGRLPHQQAAMRAAMHAAD